MTHLNDDVLDRLCAADPEAAGLCADAAGGMFQHYR
jgi:hypothetical protein